MTHRLKTNRIFVRHVVFTVYHVRNLEVRQMHCIHLSNIIMEGVVLYFEGVAMILR